jgi:hypothetical protein
MRFRIEVFSKHDVNIKTKFANMKKNINNFYKKIDQHNIINIIDELQEEHKKKYFLENPKFNKSCEFLEKYSIKEE